MSAMLIPDETRLSGYAVLIERPPPISWKHPMIDLACDGLLACESIRFFLRFSFSFLRTNQEPKKLSLCFPLLPSALCHPSAFCCLLRKLKAKPSHRPMGPRLARVCSGFSEFLCCLAWLPKERRGMLIDPVFSRQ